MKQTTALVLFILFAASALAFQGNAAKSTIEGVVLSDLTGDPVAGAEVRLGLFVGRPSTPPRPGWSEVTPDAGVSAITTGPDGRFSFKGINAGTYRIIATANGFIRQEYEQKTPYGAGKPVYVAAGQTLKDANVRLQSSGVVSGQILQDSGQPALGVPVQVLRPTYSARGRSLSPVGMTTADDRGEYRIHGIAPGRYYVLVGSSPDTPRQFVIVGNPNQSRVENYALVYYPGVADVDQAAMIEVKPAIDSHVDMRVTKRQEYHIRGRVIDATTGRPPENVQISLSFDALEGFNLTMAVARKYDSATGDFDASGVAPGTYIVQARSQNSAPAFSRDPEAIRAQIAEEARQPYGQASVTVSTADIDNLTLTISPGATIPARLFVEGQPPIDLSRFAIQLALAPYGQGSAGFSTETPPISPDGTFSFPGIHDGDYELDLNALASGFYLKSVKYAGADVLNQPIRISESKAELLEVTVQRGTGALSGLVTDRRGDPVAGIPVTLVPDQRNRRDNYRIGLTRQDGRFSIANIPPGSYKVFSWEVSELGAYFDPEFVGRDEPQGRPVVIEAESSPNVDVRLIPAFP